MAVLPPPAPGCAPCAARDAVIAEQGQGQHGARPVHPRPGGRPGAAHVSQGSDDGDHGEHQVHVKGAAPREVLGQHPPRIRPTAPPPAATEPKTPKAFPRSRGSRNVLTKVPSAAGARMAPNAPCGVRAATSIPNELAAPPIAEETANPARPVIKTRLRLNMSPIRPPISSRLPKASA